MPCSRLLPRLLLVIPVSAALFSGVGAAAERPTSATTPLTIEIEIGNHADLERLTRLVSIDHVRGRHVKAVASPGQLERIKAEGWTWRVVPEATEAAALVTCDAGWEDDQNRLWNCYPSYHQYESLMHGFANDHPGICRLVDLGPTNNLARPHRLWAVVISDNPEADEDEPEVLLSSTMHGDETPGFMLMLRLIDHLTGGYENNSSIAALVNETEIWINPLANPDGTYFAGDDTVAGAMRFYTTSEGTASEVDANRNFPSFVDGDHPDGHPWWPETEAMIAFAEAKTFVLSANFHAGVEVVNYPWDTVARRHPDDSWFQDLARDWAELAQTDGPNGYMTSVNNNGITNGHDWYQIIGGRQDYMTYFHGGREVTIELSETKLLPSDELDAMWSWNRRALLDFIVHAQEGIRGIVTDPGGVPLAATIEVLGLDREEDGSLVRTDPTIGDFHRLVLPGLYDLQIESDGYRPQLVRGIVVTEGEATEIDVILYPKFERRPSRRSAPPDGRSR